jgi:hypothetical protein
MVKIPALVLSMALASSPLAAANGLPFIADDYARARSEAIKDKLPLFVEVGAPW